MVKAGISILFTGLTATLAAQVASPFNNLKPICDSIGNYSFVVSGHFHGSSENKSHLPANTLLANLDKINARNNAMMICLGDLFMDIANDTANYRWSLFEKLQMPLFNAVGNHDLSGDIYEKKYGNTNFSFTLGNDLHIFLDTERDNGDIVRDQLKFLGGRLAFPERYNNIFIYSHRTIWKDTYGEMDGLFQDNTQSLTETNFEEEVLPHLEKAAQKTKIWWFSGSIGSAPASFFYHHDQARKISFIATGIRALPRDAILEVSVQNGEVNFTTMSLTGQPLLELEEYDVRYWNEVSPNEAFSWKLIPYYTKLALTHRYFWYGTGFALLIMLTFRWIRKRRKI